MTDGDRGDDQGGTGSEPERRAPDQTDPHEVRAVAVHADDVVAALETNCRGADGRAVLRITPPFSGRMRARIHLDQGVDDGTVGLAPERLVTDAPPLPTPDDTADELRADPDVEFTRERHRKRHEATLEAWRATVREQVADHVRLVDDHTVDVVVIGEG